MQLSRFPRFLSIILSAFIAGLVVSSCAAPGQMYQNSYDSESAAPAYDASDSYEYGEEQYAEASRSVASEKSEKRYVIRSGSLKLTVQNTVEIVKEIERITLSLGGIVSESYVYEFREGQYAANLTLRIPADLFSPAMQQLQGLGKAADVYTGDDDVTMGYLEMEARIRNLRAQEERLLEILELANTVDEVLQVERELNRVRGDIEVMTSHFNYLRDQVAFSTIAVRVQEEAIATQAISPAPFENLGSRMKEALVRSVNAIAASFAGLLIRITSLLPVLAILIPPAALVWYFMSRRRKRGNLEV